MYNVYAYSIFSLYRLLLFQVLKLYAWETSFMDKVSEVRQRELRQLRNAAYLNASFAFTFTCAPFLVRYMYFPCILFSTNAIRVTWNTIIPSNLELFTTY